MTTYQDPPLSRRAVRQGERPEQSSPPFSPPQLPRTAAGAAEPLHYVTQNRPPLPGYDTAPPRGRRAADPVHEQAAPPTTAVPAAPAAPQSFRPRDFSPEGSRTAPPAWSPAHDRDGGMVEYHTQSRSQVVPPAGGSLAASLASEPSEQTLTRRELRAIRDAAGFPPAEVAPAAPVAPAASPFPAPQQFAPGQPPQAAPQQFASPQPAPPAPQPSSRLDSALAEYDALTGRGPAGPAPGEAAPRRPGRRAARPAEEAPGFEALFGSPAPAAPAGPPAPAPQSFPAPHQQGPSPQAPQQAPAYPPAQPAPEQHAVVLPPEPAAAPLAPFDAGQFPPPVHPEAAGAVVRPTTGERPIGHWTTQAQLDDSTQVSESMISRSVGSGAITTSALVLPSLPGHDMSTGEVLLTDSVSLPSSLAATGAHSPIDESDIDHLLDPGDHQLVNTDSVPIRAIRAVSSHTSSRNVITNAKPNRGNRALTALIVSASGMVVVVVTLLVVALATEVI